MTVQEYDYIVLGCGGIGSGALYWLSKRAGNRVLGLEQFELGHHKGGSQDYSRIIRLAGYDEEMTPFTPYTYECWAEVEEESGLKIVTKTGGVYWKPDDAPEEFNQYMVDSVAAMEKYEMPYETLSAADFMERFPQFTIKDHYEVIYQKDTGLVDPSKGNAAQQQLARYHGATIIDNCPVTAIEPLEKGVRVVTEKGTFEAKKLIVTAGAWSQRLVDQFNLDLKLTVTQEQVTYYSTPNLREFAPDKFPVFLVPTPLGGIYGFPVHGEVATKAAIDLSGRAVTPETRTFDPDVAVEEYQEAWLKEHIPGFLGPKLYTKTCLYTMPQDRHFIMDTIPDHDDIIMCVGAGHAYKFSSLFGRIMSELAIDGETPHNISSMTFNRPALTDADYVSDVKARVFGQNMA